MPPQVWVPRLYPSSLCWLSRGLCFPHIKYKISLLLRWNVLSQADVEFIRSSKMTLKSWLSYLQLQIAWINLLLCVCLEIHFTNGNKCPALNQPSDIYQNNLLGFFYNALLTLYRRLGWVGIFTALSVPAYKLWCLPPKGLSDVRRKNGTMVSACLFSSSMGSRPASSQPGTESLWRC